MESITSLHVVELAEQFAEFYELFRRECKAVGVPLSERQRIAFLKCLAVQLQGAGDRFQGLAEVDALLADRRRPLFLHFPDEGGTG